MQAQNHRIFCFFTEKVFDYVKNREAIIDSRDAGRKRKTGRNARCAERQSRFGFVDAVPFPSAKVTPAVRLSRREACAAAGYSEVRSK